MRFLAWHVDRFKCRITERGRSPVVEEYDDPETVTGEALLVLVSVEKEDEAAPETVASRAVAEIAAHAGNLKVQTVVLHPFAHLFGQLSKPAVAVQVLKMVEEGLRRRGMDVIRTPFGWFNSLEIEAKGHPLSRVARTIGPGEAAG
ncbi:MAG TPA: threonyl-tRNA synthetase editing domain-containing protein [Anaerolineae bacterium]|nr:threonyl-tRNA synthetase editing domain-containing protein [Anaerolineae bacterium]